MHATKTESTVSPCGVSLDRLFADATRTGAGGIVAQSCTSDWRKVVPGDVFVALPELAGKEENGHLDAREAVARGAQAVVCEEPVPVFDVPTYLVSDSRVAFGKICQALSDNPSQTIPVIAVTGTHGKSTVVALLEAIFSLAGKHCGRISGLGCYDGMSFGAGLEVPSAPELATRLERMVAAGCTHVLLEVSSEALSHSSFAGIEFDAVCITNVTDAHLQLHNSVQNYRNLKKRVLEHLSPTGMAVFNADDPVSVKWLNQTDGPILTFGLKGQGEVTAERISEHSNEQVFVISAGSKSVAIRTPMLGEHHVSNCLAAATLALSYGIDLSVIAAGIESVESLPGHMERIDCGQGFPVFVDAADSAESLRVSLRTARQLSRGRVICVLGTSESATYSEQLAIAHVVGRLADLVVAARSLPSEEFEVRDSQKRATVEIVADRRAAIARAVATARTGDVVVVAGSRWEPQRSFGMFSLEQDHGDAATTRGLLYARVEKPQLRIAG